eukprot:948226-Alexandrium_andersonii.AAC.1
MGFVRPNLGALSSYPAISALSDCFDEVCRTMTSEEVECVAQQTSGVGTSTHWCARRAILCSTL